jgi:hypothetical protein
MKNQPTQKELMKKAEEVLRQADRAVISALWSRNEIVRKLFSSWTDEQMSYIKEGVLNPQSFRDALTLSWLNGDVDTHFHKTFIFLLDEGVYNEKELDASVEFFFH